MKYQKHLDSQDRTIFYEMQTNLKKDISELNPSVGEPTKENVGDRNLAKNTPAKRRRNGASPVRGRQQPIKSHHYNGKCISYQLMDFEKEISCTLKHNQKNYGRYIPSRNAK